MTRAVVWGELTQYQKAEAMRAAIEDGQLNGLSDWEVADLIGMSISYVSKWRRKLGFPPARRMAGNRARMDRLRKLHKSGLLDAEIAKKMHIAAGTATHYRIALGLPLNKAEDPRIAQISALKAAGLSDPQVAERLGTTRETVCRLRSKHKIKKVSDAVLSLMASEAGKIGGSIKARKRVGAADWRQREQKEA